MQSQTRYQSVKRVTIIGAFVNLFLSIIKVAAGFLGHSHALIADGIHSFSDLLTNGLVLVAAKYGSGSADDDHPYGHARIETIGSLALALFLLLVAFAIVWQAVTSIIAVHDFTKPDGYVLGFAVISVFANEVIYRYTLHVGKKVKSDLLIANALHSRSDSASSLVVVIGIGGSLLGFVYLDAIAAIVVGLLILKMGWQIAWNNVKELIDTGLEPELVQHINDVIMQVSGVVSVHELRTRRMAGRTLLDVHIMVDPDISVSEGHHIAECVMYHLKKTIAELEDVVVHIDSENDETYSSTARLPLRTALLNEVEPLWQQLPGFKQRRDIKLHYFAGRIKIDIVLPLNVLNEVDLAHLQQQYQQAVDKILIIKQVTLLFQ